MQINFSLTAIVALFNIAGACFASEKSEVLNAIADKLASDVAEAIDRLEPPRRLFIGTTANLTTELSDSESQLILDGLEVKISERVELVDNSGLKVVNTDRDHSASAEGAKKAKASHLLTVTFRDGVTVVDDEETLVEIVAKAEIIEIATGKKVYSKPTAVKYEHRQTQTVYPLRTTVSFVLGTTSAISLLGSGYFAYKKAESRKNYNDAVTAPDAERYRDDCENYRRYSMASLGVSVLSLGAALWVNSIKRDPTIYHDYDLSLMLDPTHSLFAGGVSWSF